MKDILEYAQSNPTITAAVIAAMASVFASIVAIICAIITGLSGIKAKSREAKLQGELDKATALNNQITYVQNSRFEYEFNIYKELSQKTFLLTSALNTYFFYGFRKAYSDNDTEKQRAADMREEAWNTYCVFRDSLYMAGPFIPEAMFNEFEEFRKLCQIQWQLFDNARYYETYDRQHSSQEKANENDKKITAMQDKLIKSLRLHLSKYSIGAIDTAEKQ